MINQVLRLATAEDIPTLLRFARSFMKASPYKTMTFDVEKGRRFLTSIVEGSLADAVCIVALKDSKPIGFICGQAAQPVFSSARLAVELGWWIEPDFRGTRASILIYDAYEDWAKRIGCDYVQGAYLPGVSPELDKFYKKRGYRQVESSYLKVLKFPTLELV